ncbi:MAG: DUF3299 domain-containing protein [Bacteroidota bacterium]
MRQVYVLILGFVIGLVGCENQSTSVDQADKVDSSAVSSITPKAIKAKEDAKQINWTNLANVTFKEKYFEDIQELLLFPYFSPEVKALDKQTIVISGYIIPVQPGRYVLSANPFASCFFCGNAGPESVMELELREPELIFYTDDFRSFQGRLRLNDTDVDKMNYIMEEAVVVESGEDS